MPKKVIVLNEKEFVSIYNVNSEKTYVFTFNGNIYKSNYLGAGDGFAFIPIFGSNRKIKFAYGSLQDAIETAGRHGHDVYEMNDDSELVQFIKNFYCQRRRENK